MKLNLGKRVILFFHWLISVILLVCVAFPAIPQWIAGLFEAGLARTLLIVFAIAYALLCAAAAWVIFQRDARRADRGFITVDSSETGRVRISVSAVEQMVKQAVHAVEGISEMKIAISGDDDAIAINVNVALLSGSHVPTVTMNMQRAIRQYVESNCGVSVQSVSVSIQSVVSPSELAGRRAKRSEQRAAAADVQPAGFEVPPIQPAPAPAEAPAVQEFGGTAPDEPDAVSEGEPSQNWEADASMLDEAADYAPAEVPDNEEPAGLESGAPDGGVESAEDEKRETLN